MLGAVDGNAELGGRSCSKANDLGLKLLGLRFKQAELETTALAISSGERAEPGVRRIECVP